MNITQFNKYDNFDDYCILTITSKKHGEVCVKIDIEDVKRVKAFNWYVNKNKARSNIYIQSFFDSSEGRHSVKIHRLITSFEFRVVDHVNGDSLDNRKINLREATHQQNCFNKKPRKRFKGVCVARKRTRSYIVINKKQLFLGMFDTEEDAARAYNAAAITYFGKFARLNDI